MSKISRGVAEMAAAMTISGTIGLFVVLSGQPVMNVVFWRCALGAATLLLLVGGLAAWVPARRASRVDPVVSLKNG